MHRERRQSALFASDAASSNNLLARSLFNELSRNGRNRAEMLEFVNCLLGLVAQSEGRATHVLVDSATGFPKRAALVELLLHELDPEQKDAPPHVLVLYEAKGMAEPLIFARVVRRCVRERDVVIPLSDGCVAVVLACGSTVADTVVMRTIESVSSTLAAFAARPRAAYVPLIRGEPVRRVLFRCMRRLRVAPVFKPPR